MFHPLRTQAQTTIDQPSQKAGTMNFFKRILIAGAIASVAAVVWASVANATPSQTTSSARSAKRTCHPGLYGLAGDWGIGSLLANTPANRAVIRSRYPNDPQKAYRVIHNIAPRRCRIVNGELTSAVRTPGTRITILLGQFRIESFQAHCSTPRPLVLNAWVGGTDFANIRWCGNLHLIAIS